jgi:hypothetical protein
MDRSSGAHQNRHAAIFGGVLPGGSEDLFGISPEDAHKKLIVQNWNS